MLYILMMMMCMVTGVECFTTSSSRELTETLNQPMAAPLDSVAGWKEWLKMISFHSNYVAREGDKMSDVEISTYNFSLTLNVSSSNVVDLPPKLMTIDVVMYQYMGVRCESSPDSAHWRRWMLMDGSHTTIVYSFFQTPQKDMCYGFETPVSSYSTHIVEHYWNKTRAILSCAFDLRATGSTRDHLDLNCPSTPPTPPPLVKSYYKKQLPNDGCIISEYGKRPFKIFVYIWWGNHSLGNLAVAEMESGKDFDHYPFIVLKLFGTFIVLGILCFAVVFNM